MAKKILDMKKATHEEWLEMRTHSIGGSDAGALVGMNPYSSPLTVYCHKKGLIKPVEDNEAMRLGRDLEQYVAERYMEKSGKLVRNDNFMYQHCQYPFITANIDRRIVGENAGLECKTMSGFNGYNLEAGDIPGQYYAQCQHYMLVMGFDYMDLAILVFQKGIYILHIERNESFLDGLLAAEKDFWVNYIEKNEMPAVDGSEASLETIKELYPISHADTEIEIAGLDQMIEDYKAVSEIIKEYEEKKKTIQGSICAKLGDYEAGTGDKYACTWKTQEKVSLDTKRLTEYLKREMPAVYSEFSTVSSYRVFRTKKAKKGGK